MILPPMVSVSAFESRPAKGYQVNKKGVHSGHFCTYFILSKDYFTNGRIWIKENLIATDKVIIVFKSIDKFL